MPPIDTAWCATTVDYLLFHHNRAWISLYCRGWRHEAALSPRFHCWLYCRDGAWYGFPSGWRSILEKRQRRYNELHLDTEGDPLERRISVEDDSRWFAHRDVTRSKYCSWFVLAGATHAHSHYPDAKGAGVPTHLYSKGWKNGSNTVLALLLVGVGVFWRIGG